MDLSGAGGFAPQPRTQEKAESRGFFLSRKCKAMKNIKSNTRDWKRVISDRFGRKLGVRLRGIDWHFSGKLINAVSCVYNYVCPRPLNKAKIQKDVFLSDKSSRKKTGKGTMQTSPCSNKLVPTDTRPEHIHATDPWFGTCKLAWLERATALCHNTLEHQAIYCLISIFC